MRHPAITLAALVLTACALPKTAPPDESIPLFNGKDLSNWTHKLSDSKIRMEDVWSIENGILVCKGRPKGYIMTKASYENYVLTLKWRWPKGTKGGNNGVLVHSSTPGGKGIWPKSIEVQLMRGNAGDFWIIDTELDVTNEAERKKGRRHLNLTDDSEKPIGEWNDMEITCRGDEVTVKVNGDLVNFATRCSVTRGGISLQSEGALIHYKDIVLKPIR